ncbi:arylsulfatase [bacterium]|nr:arylsulfatase [bacterium]
MFFSRRDFLRTSALASAGAVLGGVRCRVAKENPYSGTQPHIIYIMTDQHRGDCLGCMGNEAIKTPYIDSLAADGAVFSCGYTATPSCTPARSGLLTGLSPWHHGMLGYGRVAGRYRYELPRMLREAGYYTFGIGKMHWYPQKTTHGFHGTLVDESGRVETEGFVSDYHDWFHLQAPGLDPDATGIGWNEHQAGVYALDEQLHPTAWTGRTAVEFIRNYNLNQPLLLKVSFARPHSPYDPPQRFLDMYRETDIPIPYRGDWCAGFADFPDTRDAAFGDFGTAHAVNSRRHYYANITFIDEQIGKIIWELKRRGMYGNSLIMFTADHGDMLGDHCHWRKTYAYEGSAHIPFIMKWPQGMETSVKRGGRLPSPVELRDVLPTFLDAAGREIPSDMDGASLLRLVRNPGASWREYIDLEHSTCYIPENYWCALTDGKIKYIYFFPTGEEQLFDLENDPGELTQLSGKPEWAGTLKLWRQRMVRHLSERGDEWVKNGRLQIRKQGMVYGPNYPER